MYFNIYQFLIITIIFFQVVKMLILVVTMFGICWLPLHIFNLVVDFNPDLLKKEKETLLAVYLPSHWLAMANSFANPIIYGFTNDSFRVSIINTGSLLYISKMIYLRLCSGTSILAHCYYFSELLSCNALQRLL